MNGFEKGDSMPKARFGPVDQIGYLVDDLDAAIGNWIHSLGVGPWLVFRNVSLAGDYRGQPTFVTMDVALGYQDNIQIELIKVTSNVASPYRGTGGAPLAGVHHIAWLVADLDAAVADATANGLAVVFAAGNATTRVAYLEIPGQAGVLYELIEGAGMRAMIDAGIAASRVWDGTDPVTVIDMA